jgi:transposase
LLPFTSGNHHDSYGIVEELNDSLKKLKRKFRLPPIVYLNADKAFDIKALRKVCFNHGIIPNIKNNPRNQKNKKRGRKRLFNEFIYQHRFAIERTFAWIDKFRTLIIRYERKLIYWRGFHLLALTLINFKSLI